ncbi:metallophosphoesterase [Burkholderia sp. WAC0059]|uniref:metallophosphoesterase n=1 Tax=Burkholderia sp. WAC0059 TaxID=2066022 RepID=UPI000C7EC95A|nr:metallophosphoesterase [Burkholderia sp. WAC0059]PLZ00997.1 metallophosphoesterase [Burkholderia sp. WAC0059]
MTSANPPAVVHHAGNDAGRDFVVGDLHGCVDALRYLLHEIRFDPVRDRLFSVGDLVDRGAQSEGALALLDRPWFYAVLGNHEDTLCAVAQGRLSRDRWYAIGGEWAAALSHGQLAGYARRLRDLPLARVVGRGAARFNVLHAEFFGDDAELDAGDFDQTVRQRMLWGRELAYSVGPAHVQPGLSRTFCGHTPLHDVQHIGSQIFVDTGAFSAGGRLTVVEAASLRQWSVSVAEAKAAGAAALALP